jgi:hypothetical protein
MTKRGIEQISGRPAQQPSAKRTTTPPPAADGSSHLQAAMQASAQHLAPRPPPLASAQSAAGSLSPLRQASPGAAKSPAAAQPTPGASQTPAPAEPALTPKEAKAASLAAARARMQEKKRKGRTERLQARYGEKVTGENEKRALLTGFVNSDGTPDMSTYHRTRKAQFVVNSGFTKPTTGEADVSAYKLDLKKRKALEAGLVTADGKPDLHALNRQNEKESAIKAGYRLPNGEADLVAYNVHVRKYNRQMKQRAAIKGGHMLANGEADMPAYRLQEKEKGAFKAGFRTEDGTKGDVSKYNQHMRQQAAIKAGCIKPNGEADITAYNRRNQTLAAANGLLGLGNGDEASDSDDLDLDNGSQDK